MFLYKLVEEFISVFESITLYTVYTHTKIIVKSFQVKQQVIFSYKCTVLLLEDKHLEFQFVGHLLNEMWS